MSFTRPAFVVDASIAIKWLMDDEDHTSEARTILYRYQQDLIRLIAPDHFMDEVLNAIRTAVRVGRLSVDDARGAIDDFLNLSIVTIAGGGLYIHGFEIALSYGGAFYDGLYLALAERTGWPLIHADRRFHNVLTGRFAGELRIDDVR
jgi:predicted nucleic acid-binding protein